MNSKQKRKKSRKAKSSTKPQDVCQTEYVVDFFGEMAIGGGRGGGKTIMAETNIFTRHDRLYEQIKKAHESIDKQTALLQKVSVVDSYGSYSFQPISLGGTLGGIAPSHYPHLASRSIYKPEDSYEMTEMDEGVGKSYSDDAYHVHHNGVRYDARRDDLLDFRSMLEVVDDPVSEFNLELKNNKEAGYFLRLTKEALEKSAKFSRAKLGRFKPSLIKAYLDEYVSGQEEAKKILAVAAWNHVLRNSLAQGGGAGALIKKTNVVLVGPTGCGKTYLCEMLAKYLAMPIYIGDATELTPDGYVGTDCSEFVSRLFEASGQDKEKTENGIIVIDEVDKLASAQAQSSAMQRNRKSYAIGGSVKGIGTQQALLKMVEGKKTTTNQGGSPFSTKAPMPEIDTSRILFIISGAFSGITHEMGFNGRVTTDDLVNYGLMPEFVGRFPLVASLTPLTLDCLTEIIWKPKGSLVSEYKAMFEAMKIELLFTQSALKAIAGKALVKGTGARGLRGIIENALFQLMYDAPDWDARTVVVTERAIEGKEQPLINPEKRGEAWI